MLTFERIWMTTGIIFNKKCTKQYGYWGSAQKRFGLKMNLESFLDVDKN